LMVSFEKRTRKYKIVRSGRNPGIAYWPDPQKLDT
jgi:hypothetical protein